MQNKGLQKTVLIVLKNSLVSLNFDEEFYFFFIF